MSKSKNMARSLALALLLSTGTLLAGPDEALATNLGQTEGQEMILKEIQASEDQISGRTKPGARVNLTRLDGSSQGITAGEDGSFTIRLAKPFENEEVVTLEARLGEDFISSQFKLRVSPDEKADNEDKADPTDDKKDQDKEVKAEPKLEDPVQDKEKDKDKAQDKDKGQAPDEAKDQPRPSQKLLRGQRLAGSDRYQTAIEVSKASHPAGAKAVVIASGVNTADALAAGPLAIEKEAPILLMGDRPSTELIAELTRLKPAEVFIVGGEKTIPKDVEDALPGKKTRLAGADRYETSVEIAKYLKENHGYQNAILTNGGNTVDALASSAYAARYKKAILLSPGQGLRGSVKAYIDQLGPASVDIVGGVNSISTGLQTQLGGKYRNRVYGTDRYDTAVQLASFTYNASKPAQGYVLVSADNAKLVDALAAAPFAYQAGSPILLSNGRTLDGQTKGYIADKGLKDFAVIGGANTVSQDLVDSLAKGPGKEPGPAVDQTSSDKKEEKKQDPIQLSAKESEISDALLNLVNDKRKAKGAGVLKLEPGLNEGARTRAKEIVRTGKLSSQRPDGTSHITAYGERNVGELYYMSSKDLDQMSGQALAEEIFQELYEEEVGERLMTDPSYKKLTLAVEKLDSGRGYVAIVALDR